MIHDFQRTYEDVPLSELIGKTLKSIEVIKNGEDVIKFTADTGESWIMFHSQDCCEDVKIEDISGEINDLIGAFIIIAEEVTSRPKGINKNAEPANWEHANKESYTWTFYKFRTIKGDVTIRWFGQSNGYYSESVKFEKLEVAS